MFEGFYYTGTPSVGVFVQKTSDGGFILYDAMYSNNTAARPGVDLIVSQLAAAGMNITDLRAIVITHGHGDHDGAVSALMTAAGKSVPVYIGSADLTTNKPYRNVAVVNDSSDPAPKVVDIAGIPLTVLAAPGHTPGTNNFIVPVTYQAACLPPPDRHAASSCRTYRPRPSRTSRTSCSTNGSPSTCRPRLRPTS